jgi:type IV pilus assembly protein PilM
LALTLPSLFRRTTPPLLGVDLCTSGVKVVELSRGASALRLERYAIEPIAAGVIVDGNIEQSEAVVEALGRALRRLGSKVRLAALAMPSSAVITKRITLPAGLDEEAYEVEVESEATQYIQFPIEEVNLDFQVLGPAQGDNEVEVLLVASRKEKVEDRIAIAELCGLKPMVMDIDAYAAREVIGRTTAMLPDAGRGLVIALVDIGAVATRVTIFLEGQNIFERTQPMGGAQLTMEIARLYGFTQEEAELRKKTGDLPENYRDDVLAPFVDELAADAARALQFFFSSAPYARVDRLYLAGGACVAAGLAEAVSDRTGVSVEILNPFAGMDIAGTVRERQLRVDAPGLLTATGLALRSFDP